MKTLPKQLGYTVAIQFMFRHHIVAYIIHVKTPAHTCPPLVTYDYNNFSAHSFSVAAVENAITITETNGYHFQVKLTE